MASLVLSLLGPFQATYGQQRLSHLRVRSAQALLILLTVEGRAQQREQLVDLLWPGMPLASGRKNLRQALYELRQLFPVVGARDEGAEVPLLLADRQTIRINEQAAVFLDLDQFDALLQTKEPHKLAQAVDLYRGDFLSDFFLPDSSTFEAWVAARRAAYRRQVLEALTFLAGEAVAAGEFEDALRHAQRALELDDLQETAVRQLMQALAALGRRAEALQIYHELQQRLREALDVDPALETSDLFEKIRESGESRVASGQVASNEVAEPGSTELGRRVEGPRHNLPGATTPFIGRERELDEIEQLLTAEACHLLTLLGPGGIGKSRLALAVASRLVQKGAFPDGVWFVRLAALDDESQIVPAVVAQLSFDLQGAGTDAQRQLFDYLRDKKMLLLLDNMEQLLGDTPPEPLRALMAAAPGVTLLATSRAPLRLQGEQLFPLTGLALPETIEGLQTVQQDRNEQAQPLSNLPLAHSPLATQYDALHLFEVCARRIRPDFRLEEENLAAVLQIARRVEGFPLGLEMAAAWIELLSPGEIAEQLSDSFDLLEADWSSEKDRHQQRARCFRMVLAAAQG